MNFIHSNNVSSSSDISVLKTNFEDLIYGCSPIRKTTLARAAKISPQIGENSFLHRESSDMKSNTNLIINNKPKKNSIQGNNLKNVDSTDPEDSIDIELEHFIDFKTINNNCLMKANEKQRKEQVKKKTEERLRLQLTENNKRKKENLNITPNSNNLIDYRNRKIENDKEILAAVELEANEKAAEDRLAIEKLYKDKKQKLQKICYDAIANWQSLFFIYYEKVAIMLKTADKKIITNFEQFNNISRELIEKFNNIIKKIKVTEAEPHDNYMAQQLCYSMQNLANKLADLLKCKAQQKENHKQLPQQQQSIPLENNATNISNVHVQQQENYQNQTKKSLKSETTEKSISGGTGTKDVTDSYRNNFLKYVSSERLQFYIEIMNYYNDKNVLIKPLQNDSNTKSFRMSCKKILQITVSSICAVSSQHIQDKFNKIKDFITGKNVKRTNSDVHIQDHPLGKDYCLVLLASIFVQQSETEVSSNQNASFPLASIIISLWNHVPEFGKIFLGCMFKHSPYLVPYFIPKMQNQSNEEFFRNLGYKNINGQLEDQNLFLQRQAGIIRLYAAIIISSGQQADGHQHPYGLENGWRWLCNFVKLSPLPDICATLLYEFIKIAGFELWSLYRYQFKKLLILIRNEYIGKLAETEDREPTKIRLESFLDELILNNSIEKPQGILSKSYW